MPQTNSYLQVVNASAGSGKTFSLVKTYIRLLLLDEDAFSDRKYSEILAMTFTNKAALEMKTRILKALDELAYPEKSDYINQIVADTGLKKEVVQKKAMGLLSGILHHYEDFHVMTIDKFNLRLIRSFSRDLDLPSDFEVVLNEELIIEQVVDGILEKIGKDSKLTTLLLKYASSNLEDEKGWNLRKSLINFAKIISYEQDLPYVERLMKMEFSENDFKEHKKELRRLSDAYQTKCDMLRTRYFDLGLNDDSVTIPYKNHVNSSIEKSKKVMLPAIFLFSESSLKNLEKASAKSAAVEQFYGDVLAVKSWFDIATVDADVLDKFLKNYFNMQLLQFLNEDLTELNKKERLIRISEFNTKISELLQEDTLYIYEKLGTRFRHFMLDEFQDTSRLQWLNLIPLIRESLGHGNKNFIVGDPKQAIYRFKNGVAEQFVALPGIYNPEKNPEIEEASTYFKQMGIVESLEDNWRSAADIVAFNNDLFEDLKHKLNDYQRSFYMSVKQNPKSGQRGYVYVESSKKQRDDKRNELQQAYLQFINQSILEAVSDGYKPGDICILGRSNSTCIFIANQLSMQGYSVVSADSLNIDSELSVRFVLSYLKLRLNPVNQNIIKQFFHQYCLLFEKELDYYNSLFETIETPEGKIYKIAKIDLFLQKNSGFSGKLFEPFETLYDLVEKTYHLFGLNELKNPYLHHFADLVHQFESKNGPDLNIFLQDYDSMSKDTKALQIPESDEAIKVMTIHKSKGLEFPIVIVINEAGISSSKKEFFVETENYLLRTTLNKTSPIAEVSTLNEEENQKIYLDSLNMYYVAYTRPVNRLYVKNIYESEGLLTDFHNLFSAHPTAVEENDTVKLIQGEKTQKQSAKQETHSEYFTPVSSRDNLWFPDIALQDTDELHSEDFLSDEQRYGNQFHLIISSIHHKDEIEKTISRLLLTGAIEQAFEQQLKSDLHQLFSTDAYNQLFENAIEILNEQSYIISKNEQMRPDKIILKKDKTVVLDFKTGQPLKKHQKQLREYCSVLQEMNYPNVEAHLLYTKNFELVGIDL